MKIIALSGWKKSGKDTLAKVLIDNHNFKRISFADPLRELVSKEYCLLMEFLEDQKYKEMPLLLMPVNPKDEFSRIIVDYLRQEFRNEDGGFDLSKPLFWTPRALMILKGSSNRATDPNFWVSKAINSIFELNNNGQENFIITDLRYKSELFKLKEVFGESLISVRINRFKNSDSTDPSERDLDNESFDYYIQNNGTLEEFNNKINNLIVKLKELK